MTDEHGQSAQGLITLVVGDNTAPTGADNTLTTAEDTRLVLSLADFGFADADTGQVLSAVVITSLPGSGELLLDGIAVSAGQTIDQARIAEAGPERIMLQDFLPRDLEMVDLMGRELIGRV